MSDLYEIILIIIVSFVMTAGELDVCGCDSFVSDRAGDSSGVEVVDDVVVCGDDTLLLDALCDTSNGYKYRLDRGGGVIAARAAAPAKQVRHRCSSNSKGPTGHCT